MQQYSTSAETAKQNKASGIAKTIEKQMGRDQKHALEGVSIYLLLEFIVSLFPTFCSSLLGVPESLATSMTETRNSLDSVFTKN
jgi:hypothetical protein